MDIRVFLQASEAAAVPRCPKNRRNTDQTERVPGKVNGRTDVQTSGIPGPAAVSAPYPAGRELELFNLVLA
jgi:hypothetical protein